MAKHEAPLHALATYLPEGAYPAVVHYLETYKVHLTITRARKTVLGDYRNAHRDKNHRISVNGNLNPYAFLITLLHELAHLLTYERYGNRVSAHGREWKDVFGQVLATFMQHHTFPADIEAELRASLHNPGASSCAEEELMRILRRYDSRPSGMKMVEELPEGTLFLIDTARMFKKGEKLRKRFRCVEVKTGKIYLFSGVYEVHVVEG
jgi:SprT protein